MQTSQRSSRPLFRPSVHMYPSGASGAGDPTPGAGRGFTRPAGPSLLGGPRVAAGLFIARLALFGYLAWFIFEAIRMRYAEIAVVLQGVGQ